ncbi:nuclear transport factor 2 family protein [Sciscionella marina]|uniref:nuclear transport factor 2 family protein n=1 Tax=Sciscionella marina TaxID=508770 RepID=UPI00037CFFB3|nr:nuclear transport factor 2 family protein [Sciscionella marina]
MALQHEQAASGVDDAAVPDIDVGTMTRDELIAHNLRVVEAHFHNENPELIDKALAVYGPDIVWEAPARGLVYDDVEEVREGYLGIFRTVHWNRTTSLRRFATEDFVFDDQIADLTVVGTDMPNLPFEPGQRISMRLIHCFEMKDGKIAREITYEIPRSHGGPLDNDAVPAGAVVTDFPDGPDYGKWAAK